MLEKIKLLYGRNAADVEGSINELIQKYQEKLDFTDSVRKLSQKDSILITYADSIQEDGVKGLKTLDQFLQKYMGDVISGVHMLPFYPYSSDDGFSVIDYLKVNEAFGQWSDVDRLGQNYDLMFDAVINHISQYSAWYKGFCNGDPEYSEFFILCDPELDYSKVVRPRALPLLTACEVKGEKRWVWTTFSEDQIDLNYSNPKVLLKVLQVLMEYVGHGAKLIRLDAIGFAWKELGTNCIHLPQTHTLIQLMREVLLAVREDLVIITETNVPHKENISYFGNGYNEAHLVYQFPLPPLTLHALLTGDGSKLSKWAGALEHLTESTTFFNFLASHDGIGLRPVENTLNGDDVQVLLDAVERNGGRVNYKNNSDGSKSPYEMNINYMDALEMPGDSEALHIRRFIAAQGILYSMKGVPGIYIHSMLGSTNDLEGMVSSGINRRINREKLDLDTLEVSLMKEGRRKSVLDANLHMLKVRKGELAFDPFGQQELVEVHKGVFCLRRTCENETIYVIINLKSTELEVTMPAKGVDLLSGRRIGAETLRLQAYEILWIKEA